MNALVAEAESAVLNIVLKDYIGDQPLANRFGIYLLLGITQNTTFSFDGSTSDLLFKGVAGSVDPAKEIRRLKYAVQAHKRGDVLMMTYYVKSFLLNLNQYGELTITPEPDWYADRKDNPGGVGW